MVRFGGISETKCQDWLREVFQIIDQTLQGIDFQSEKKLPWHSPFLFSNGEKINTLVEEPQATVFGASLYQSKNQNLFKKYGLLVIITPGVKCNYFLTISLICRDNSTLFL